jgi:hypothetical protein
MDRHGKKSSACQSFVDWHGIFKEALYRAAGRNQFWPLWHNYDGTLMLLRNCDASVTQLWWHCDTTAMPLWRSYNSTVMLLWCYYDATVMALLRNCDGTVTQLWWHCYATVMPLWCYCNCNCDATVPQLWRHCVCNVTHMWRRCDATVIYAIVTSCMWRMYAAVTHLIPVQLCHYVLYIYVLPTWD